MSSLSRVHIEEHPSDLPTIAESSDEESEDGGIAFSISPPAAPTILVDSLPRPIMTIGSASTIDSEGTTTAGGAAYDNEARVITPEPPPAQALHSVLKHRTGSPHAAPAQHQDETSSHAAAKRMVSFHVSSSPSMEFDDKQANLELYTDTTFDEIEKRDLERKRMRENASSIPSIADSNDDEEQKPEASPSSTKSGGDDEDSWDDVSKIIRDILGPNSKQQAMPPSQMLIELFDKRDDDDVTWHQSARWLKFEEDAEGKDEHWGQAHLAFLTMTSLLQLKKLIQTGVLLLDVQATTFDDIITLISQSMFKFYQMKEANMQKLLNTLRQKQEHVQLAGNLSRKMSWMDGMRRQSSHSNFSDLVRKFSRAHSMHKDAAHAHHVENGNISMESIVEQPESEMLLELENTVLEEAPIIWRTRSGTTTSETGGGGGGRGSRRTSMSDIHQDGVSDNQQQQQQPNDDQQPLPRNDSLHRLQSTASSCNMNWVIKHLPHNAEAAQIFAGELPELAAVRFAFVRLATAAHIPEFLTVNIPIRFVIVILGPPIPDVDYHELGRSMGALMANQHFQQSVFRARTRHDLTLRIDAYLHHTLVVMPPEENSDGEIDEKLYSAKDTMMAIRRRRKKKVHRKTVHFEPPKVTANGEVKEKAKPRKRLVRDPFRRADGFGEGLKQDLSDRLPYYKSDFTDAWHPNTITTTLFMIFAALAPAVTFGGLMGKYTNDYMGVSETLLATALCGLIWGLTSAQPLILQCATGPVLFLEASLYIMCASMEIDYMPMRLWASLWMGLFFILSAFVQISPFLKYVTRFSEDIFSALISLIFLFESLMFIKETFVDHPTANIEFYWNKQQACLSGAVTPNPRDLPPLTSYSEQRNITLDMCSVSYQPDTALMTLAVVTLTFFLVYGFRYLRQTFYLGREMRRTLSDLGVIISVLIIGFVDKVLFPTVYLKKVDVGYAGSVLTDDSQRGWLIGTSITGANWAYPAAAIPAFLGFLLIAAETQITELVMCKKEICLRKGSGGYNWDLIVVGVSVVLCGVFGLPWMCASGAQSLAHADALTVWRSAAPGTKASVVRVIEQRVTTIVASLAIAGCVLARNLLAHLPLGVLYGVLIYFAVTNLFNVQLVERTLLLFVPPKYFPSVPYCQKLTTWAMHRYTLLQLVLLVFLFVMKSIKESAMLFPFLMLLVCLLRMFILPKMYTHDELHAIDAHEDNHREMDSFIDLTQIRI